MRYPGEAMQQQYIERVVDLTEPEANQIHGLSVEEAREIILRRAAEAVGHILGSFALVAREGKTVRMARSLDRPMRYFLAKRQEGPVLIVAPRIDLIFEWLAGRRACSAVSPQLYEHGSGAPRRRNSAHRLPGS